MQRHRYQRPRIWSEREYGQGRERIHNLGSSRRDKQQVSLWFRAV